MSEHVTIKVLSIDEDDLATIDVEGTVNKGTTLAHVHEFPEQSAGIDELYSGRIQEGELLIDSKYPQK